LIVQRVNGGVINQPGAHHDHPDHRARRLSRPRRRHPHQVDRLQQLADDHFGHDPDAIHWGHVGDLGRVDQALDDLLAIFDGQAK
jgi:hypothetical protein